MALRRVEGGLDAICPVGGCSILGCGVQDWSDV